MMDEAAEPGRNHLVIDLPVQTISLASGAGIRFDIFEGRKTALVNGLDPIGATLQHCDEITAWEQAYLAHSTGLA